MIVRPFLFLFFFSLFFPISIPNPIFSFSLSEIFAFLCFIGFLEEGIKNPKKLINFCKKNIVLCGFFLIVVISLLASFIISIDKYSAFRGLLKYFFAFSVFLYFISHEFSQSEYNFLIKSISQISYISMIFAIISFIFVDSWTTPSGFRFFNIHPNTSGQIFLVAMVTSTKIFFDSRKLHLSFLSFILGFILIFLSGNKTALLLSILFSFYFLYKFILFRQTYLLLFIFILIPIFSSVIVTVYQLDYIQRLIEIFSNPMGYRTIIARFDIYSNALILIKNYPFGLGVYNIELLLRDDFGTLLNHPHNIILQFFLEIGIIGAVSLLFFIFILFFKGLFLSQSSRVFIVVCVLYFLMNNLSGGFSAVSHLIFWSYLGLSTNFLYNGSKSDA